MRLYTQMESFTMNMLNIHFQDGEHITVKAWKITSLNPIIYHFKNIFLYQVDYICYKYNALTQNNNKQHFNKMY